MFNLDNLKIRTKLILLLFVPVLALLLFAGLGWNERNDTAQRADTDKHVVEAAAATSELMAALQHEAVAAVGHVAGVDGELELAELQQATDDAAARFSEANAALDLKRNSEGANAVSAALGTLDTTLEGIARYRDRLGSFAENRRWVDVADNYRTNSLNRFVDYVQELAKLTTTPEVVLPLEQLAALLDYNLQTSSLAVMVVTTKLDGDEAWSEGLVDPDLIVEEGERPARLPSNALTAREVAVAQGVKNAVLTRVAGSSGPIKSYLDQNVSPPSALGRVLANDWQVAEAMSGDTSSVVPESMAIPSQDVAVSEVQQYVTDLSGAAAELTDRTVAQIDTQRSDAIANARLYLLLGGLAILAAILAAVLITVSITRRLARLTDAAERLSHEQLPRLVDSLKNPAEEDVDYLTASFTEIDVTGSDEIGLLAGAFNRIQGVAVEVAAEQAQLLRKGIGDMFINLARRNQSLLDRQIEFIDELERAEEDPDQLENLFRLDHLATRMRRNAESLLVLAGAEPSRRRGRPVPLADVVRAAVGEVEDFSRIDMLQFDEVMVASNAALDIAHLLSELMENAANFSPPDTRVEVVGHRTKAEGYVISVTDHGIGMSTDAIAEANDLLARPPLVGLAMSRSLGFIVIGRLAARFGIAVRLMPAPTGGTTAMVSLPPTLITDGSASPRGPGELPETAADPDGPAAVDGASAREHRTDPRPPAARPAPSQVAPAAPPAAPIPAAPATTATRQAAPAAGDLPVRGERLPRRDGGTTRTAEPAPAEASEPTPVTASGLAKRVPRRAGGQRAVPGGEGERAATQNRRSPEEVRSMLSRYRSGMQRGRSEDDDTAQSTDRTPKDPGP